MASCSSCHAPIVWMRTAPRDGKPARSIPVDAHLDGDEIRPLVRPAGNLALTGNQVPGRIGPVPEVRVVTPGVGSFVSHFATCPNSRLHRKDHTGAPRGRTRRG